MADWTKASSEDLVGFAARLANDYADVTEEAERKEKGQIFTPPAVARFMSSLFALPETESSIQVLDPGAGTGTLAAALCQRIAQSHARVRVQLDAYEPEPALARRLRRVLAACDAELSAQGGELQHRVMEEGFILAHEGALSEMPLLWQESPRRHYDMVISNPPYYKLSRHARQAKAARKLVKGQPNIYALIMGLSVSLLNRQGQAVFITPRSFCSGLYYKRFRRWLLSKVRIDRIHSFVSRKEIFRRDNVLQENMILKCTKTQSAPERVVRISVSRNSTLEHLTRIQAAQTDILTERSSESFIRIPCSQTDLEILRLVDSWPETFGEMGFAISTGPVVAFRARQYLLKEPVKNGRCVPLLWMHNVRHWQVKWPILESEKPQWIRVCDGSQKLLVPTDNYVLLKRFSSKEQKRRLDGALLLREEFPERFLGLENHLNYIYGNPGSLTPDEARGIAAILNSRLIDRYFRCLNGNTQVNATEIRNLPLPPWERIAELGVRAREIEYHTENGFTDTLVSEVLDLPATLAEKLVPERVHGKH